MDEDNGRPVKPHRSGGGLSARPRTMATMAALAVAFVTEAEMFALTALRGPSLPSHYPKRTEAESAARLAAAEEERQRRAAKRKTPNAKVSEGEK